MIAGVTSFGPSQLTPANGVAKVLDADRDAVLAVLDVLEREGAVVRGCDGLDASRLRAATRSTVTPGSPTSPLSTSPGVPPPGLKSRQTTPVMPPCSGSGWTAWTASAGTSPARIAVSPSRATSPGSATSSSVSPDSVVPGHVVGRGSGLCEDAGLAERVLRRARSRR